MDIKVELSEFNKKKLEELTNNLESIQENLNKLVEYRKTKEYKEALPLTRKYIQDCQYLYDKLLKITTKQVNFVIRHNEY